MIKLTYSLFTKHHPPHRQRKVAEYVTTYGVVVRLIANWPRTEWFVTASKDGYRVANTIKTTVRRIADGWREDLIAGNVEIE
jgi:hypothetical protein